MFYQSEPNNPFSYHKGSAWSNPDHIDTSRGFSRYKQVLDFMDTDSKKILNKVGFGPVDVYAKEVSKSLNIMKSKKHTKLKPLTKEEFKNILIQHIQANKSGA
jgi:hypothetical protein